MRSGDTFESAHEFLALLQELLASGCSCALILAVACGFSAPPTGRLRPGTDRSRVDFTRQIRPLLSDRCFRCHGPDASRRKAELRLDLREGAFKKLPAGWAIVKPGDPAKSELDSPHHHRRDRRRDAAGRIAPVAQRGREGPAHAMGGGRRRLQAALVVRAGLEPSLRRRRQDPRRSIPSTRSCAPGSNRRGSPPRRPRRARC